MKRSLSLILTVVISFTLLIPSIGAEPDITVTLNGYPITFDQPPIIQDGRTLVPMRAIFEALGADVHWVEDLQVIIAFKGHSVSLMKIGEKELYVTDTSAFDTLQDIQNQIYYAAYGSDYDEEFSDEGNAIENFMQSYEFDVVPQIINGRTLIPIRAISEALGVTVDWDGDNKVVNLSCSDEFISEGVINQNLVDEIMHLYDVWHTEVYKSHQGGHENLESEYILKPNSDLKFNHKTISGGGSSGLAVQDGNSLWGWGDSILPLGEWPDPDGVRLLENKYSNDLSTPVKLMDDVLTVAAGEAHSIAIKTDGSLWIWGSNVYAQIGDGTSTQYISIFGTFPIWTTRNDKPIPVNIMTDVAYVAAGGLHSLAVKTDGSLWTWGYNSYGQLGNGTRLPSTRPHKVMDNVISVAASYYSSFALGADGGLWAWGENGGGDLGNGKSGFLETEDGYSDLEHNTLPEKIMDDVVYISAGYTGSAAVKADGSLWVWGGAPVPEDITVTDRSIPNKVMNDVIAAEVANGYIMALKTDGSLWAWGRSWYGLFDDDINESSTPKKIMDGVAYINSGLSVDSLAVKTDGSLWAIGGRENKEGQSEILDGMILKVD